MDAIDKTLQKLSAKERTWIADILERLSAGQSAGLDIKKLKGRDNIFRVRKGSIRIIYRMDDKRGIFVLAIERRREDTYKSFL